jgi:tRNA nucleotidyltransferase (CCA-adding enzyme)
LGDGWSRRLFVALLRRHGINPYRYRGQRRTTVMVRVPRRFVDETLWPEFEKLSATLRTFLDDITERVIRESVFADDSEAEEVAEPRALADIRIME